MHQKGGGVRVLISLWELIIIICHSGLACRVQLQQFGNGIGLEGNVINLFVLNGLK